MRKRKGFTLVDGAVVLVIVMVLIALLLPAISGEINAQQYAKIIQPKFRHGGKAGFYPV